MLEEVRIDERRAAVGSEGQSVLVSRRWLAAWMFVGEGTGTAALEGMNIVVEVLG